MFATAMIIAMPVVHAQTGKTFGDVMRERAQRAVAAALPPPPPPTKPAGYAIQNLPAEITRRLLTTFRDTRTNIYDGIAWIDNRRVLLLGQARGAPLGIHIWDTAANTVTQYSNHTQLCFADGYVSAIGPSTGKPSKNPSRGTEWVSPFRYGLFGSEKNVICDTEIGKVCPGFLNMSCKQANFQLKAYKLPESAAVVVQLREGEGAIVTPVYREWWIKQPISTREDAKTAFGKPLLLVNANSPKGKSLPILAIEEIRRAAYSAYAKRYVFVTEKPKDGARGISTNWPADQLHPVYLMSSRGETETIEIPSTYDWDRVVLAQPAVPGIVFEGSGVRSNLGGGLFLFNGKEVLALDTGYVETFAVSPDGCKVAYGIVNNYGKAEPQEANFIVKFKLIKLCREE